jgi:hypothetical protein
MRTSIKRYMGLLVAGMILFALTATPVWAQGLEEGVGEASLASLADGGGGVATPDYVVIGAMWVGWRTCPHCGVQPTVYWKDHDDPYMPWDLWEPLDNNLMISPTDFRAYWVHDPSCIQVYGRCEEYHVWAESTLDVNGSRSRADITEQWMVSSITATLYWTSFIQWKNIAVNYVPYSPP